MHSKGLICPLDLTLNVEAYVEHETYKNDSIPDCEVKKHILIDQMV